SFIQKIDDEVSKKVLRLQKVKQQEPVIQTQNLQTNTDEVDDINTGTREFSAGADYEQAQTANATLKASSVISKALKERDLRKLNLSVNSSSVKETNKNITMLKQYGRNDRVTVKYSDGRVEKDVKYKKVEKDLMEGKCVII